MSPSSPLISVIMAVYNGEDFVAEALGSIVRQMYTPMEIVVIDDGSTDATARIVQDAALIDGVTLRYVHQANQGLSAARNNALGLARGEVIGFLDQDDLWSEGRLDAQLAQLETSSNTGGAAWMVLGRMQFFVDGACVNAKDLDNANRRPYHHNLSAGLFLRRAFQLVGSFDESVRWVADWDWFVRAQEVCVPTVIVPEITVLRRIHTTNVTRQRESGARLTIQMIKQALDRRRAQDGVQK